MRLLRELLGWLQDYLQRKRAERKLKRLINDNH